MFMLFKCIFLELFKQQEMYIMVQVIGEFNVSIIISIMYNILSAMKSAHHWNCNLWVPADHSKCSLPTKNLQMMHNIITAYTNKWTDIFGLW